MNKIDMEFEYCPHCGGDLDTGWECNDCGRDWLPWAYPWWKSLKENPVKFIKKMIGWI